MTDYVLPAGWKFNGSKENQTTFTGPGHTVGAPYLAIFDRVVPQVNGNGTYTNPSYKVRLIRGFVDGDGHPIPGRAVVEVNVRWSISSDPNVIAAMLDMGGVFLSSAVLQQDITEEQLLPRSALTD